MNKLFKNRGVVTKASCYTCGKNHSKIGKLVQENLDKLDDKTLIEMIENNVGKDLVDPSERGGLRIYDWISVRRN